MSLPTHAADGTPLTEKFLRSEVDRVMAFGLSQMGKPKTAAEQEAIDATWAKIKKMNKERGHS